MFPCIPGIHCIISVRGQSVSSVTVCHGRNGQASTSQPGRMSLETFSLNQEWTWLCPSGANNHLQTRTTLYLRYPQHKRRFCHRMMEGVECIHYVWGEWDFPHFLKKWKSQVPSISAGMHQQTPHPPDTETRAARPTLPSPQPYPLYPPRLWGVRMLPHLTLQSEILSEFHEALIFSGTLPLHPCVSAYSRWGTAGEYIPRSCLSAAVPARWQLKSSGSW